MTAWPDEFATGFGEVMSVLCEDPDWGRVTTPRHGLGRKMTRHPSKPWTWWLREGAEFEWWSDCVCVYWPLSAGRRAKAGEAPYGRRAKAAEVPYTTPNVAELVERCAARAWIEADFFAQPRRAFRCVTCGGLGTSPIDAEGLQFPCASCDGKGEDPWPASRALLVAALARPAALAASEAMVLERCEGERMPCRRVLWSWDTNGSRVRHGDLGRYASPLSLWDDHPERVWRVCDASPGLTGELAARGHALSCVDSLGPVLTLAVP